ncbi:hypothetical protein RBB50_012874 [Rhinocladiella similis]
MRPRVTSVKAWRLGKEPASFAPAGVASNKDQDPVPQHLRTWGAWDYASYWMSDLINATTWQIASASLVVGLSTKDALAIASLAAVLNALPTVLCGMPGADHHIPFPISIRSVYGYWFSYFCVISRALLGTVWFGVNCYYGSFIVTEIVAAVWPSYRNIENHLPASAHITTQQMVSYILFVIVQFPFLLIPVHRLKTLFMVKAILLWPISITMVIWICVKAGDTKGIFNQPATATGSTRVWLWLFTLSANTNSWLSSTINMPDFTRFAKNKRAPWAMLPTIPFVRIVYAVLGVAMAGAGRVLYGEYIWNPTELLSKWTGSGGRFLAFCCGCLWLLAQVSTNVSANAAPFGHDAMNIGPAWINVRRGSILCMLIGAFAMVPWLLVNTAAKFINFMNGYGAYISTIVSIQLADYLVVRHRNLDIPALYNPQGRYRYKAGINWRAASVQVLFMAISTPGLVKIVSPGTYIPIGFQRIYDVNWFINTICPFLVYWLMYSIYPDKGSLVPSTISGFTDGCGTPTNTFDDNSQNGGDVEKAAVREAVEKASTVSKTLNEE